ncbi:hydroxyacylglutathione hydrolase [Marinimicrobium alkaliphilum]|uniref:hydroxyacylglutathione hydrolase n=1 Tax=Marinimicrobium alkaliphilum TaxID=2202654 RepID=UPI000DBAB7B4|nr:hydroxyacylglutathione hydrolase [Marinimicrobium alkaliphilum]
MSTRPRIYALPALDSNYFWLLQPDPGSPDAYIIDPGDAEPVLTALTQRDLKLKGILITHHHWDHTDGLPALLARHPVPVWGPASERIPQVTRPLAEGDRVALPGMPLTVLAVPGHTLDHIAYLHQPAHGAAQLFCGDALFAAGCGRMFEGEPAQMLNSLDKLAQLPDDTLVYCAHEYTLANLDFARTVEPGNDAINERCVTEMARRREGQATIPTRVGLERRTNPFLRCREPAVQRAAADYSGQALPDAAAVFASLRRWKDGHKTGTGFLDRYPRNP